MSENEVLVLWKSGLSKHKVAEIYKRRYNQQIKLMRTEVVNRHRGRFISSYEALAVVERIIYKKVKTNEKNKCKKFFNR